MADDVCWITEQGHQVRSVIGLVACNQQYASDRAVLGAIELSGHSVAARSKTDLADGRTTRWHQDTHGKNKGPGSRHITNETQAVDVPWPPRKVRQRHT